MPMEQIRRNQAVTKHDFHLLLRQWIADTDDAIVGSETVQGRTSWVHVRDGTTMFSLHADATREAVTFYLQLVKRYGEDLAWNVTISQRGKMTAVVYGPQRVRHKPFYLYVV